VWLLRFIILEEDECLNDQVILAPQKGSQEVAMQSIADVIIYGGAAK
jgi:hypothetical protein